MIFLLSLLSSLIVLGSCTERSDSTGKRKYGRNVSR
jgi:hypothetical protein